MKPVIRALGLQEYQPVWQQMQQYTEQRHRGLIPDRDQIWLLQHTPVFTQGLAGKPEHLLNPGHIPVVKIDRGGQVTYHGPGQLVVYLLLNMKHWQIGVRELVRLMEQAVIDLLATFQLTAQGSEQAPGVYVDNAKIAALGLKVRHGYCYHGLSLNVDMDLTPFSLINPCGYAGQAVTQCCEQGIETPLHELQSMLSHHLILGLQHHLNNKRNQL